MLEQKLHFNTERDWWHWLIHTKYHKNKFNFMNIKSIHNLKLYGLVFLSPLIQSFCCDENSELCASLMLHLLCLYILHVYCWVSSSQHFTCLMLCCWCYVVDGVQEGGDWMLLNLQFKTSLSIHNLLHVIPWETIIKLLWNFNEVE